MPRLGSGFDGFPSEAFRFFELLGADNTKAFWTLHKGDYDRFVRAPFEALAPAVAAEFGPLHVFRPNRDVRFSKDKSPYKTHCGAVTEAEGGETYYLQISSDGLLVASGYYGFAGDQLERYREAVDSNAGEVLDRLLESCREQRFDIGGSALKSVPRGYPRDHPLVHLLRHKGVYVSRSFAVAKWVHTREGARPDRDDMARRGAVAPMAQPIRRPFHGSTARVVRQASTDSPRRVISITPWLLGDAEIEAMAGGYRSHPRPLTRMPKISYSAFCGRRNSSTIGCHDSKSASRQTSRHR